MREEEFELVRMLSDIMVTAPGFAEYLDAVSAILGINFEFSEVFKETIDEYIAIGDLSIKKFPDLGARATWLGSWCRGYHRNEGALIVAHQVLKAISRNGLDSMARTRYGYFTTGNFSWSDVSVSAYGTGEST